MSAGGELRLPEPARGLWLRTRDAIRTSLDEIGISEYAIGGGTILAARWNHHRASDDIDLSLPANARLDRLDDQETCGLRRRMERLGGECDPETQGVVYRIAFAGQGIDLRGERRLLASFDELPAQSAANSHAPPMTRQGGAAGLPSSGSIAPATERRRTTYSESSSSISAYVPVSTIWNDSPIRSANVCAV